MQDRLCKRDAVLAAADELQGKESELRLEQDAATDFRNELAAAMAKAGAEVAQDTGLAQMAARTKEYVEEAMTRCVTKQGLLQQQADSKVALEQAKQAPATFLRETTRRPR